MADSDLDPQAFLKTVRDLSEKRQREDTERYEKLEADIVNDRNARLARRLERERSLSPEKSVSYTPRSPLSNASPATSAPSTPRQLSALDQDRGRTMSPASPIAASSTPDRSVSPTKPSSPSAAMPSRANTMSWQRRPNSTLRSRPLSVVAAENHAARSPFAESPVGDVRSTSQQEMTRPASMYDAPSPRAASPQGRTSPAYRRNVEYELEAESSAARNRSPVSSRSPTRTLPHHPVTTSAQTSPLRQHPSTSALDSPGQASQSTTSAAEIVRGVAAAAAELRTSPSLDANTFDRIAPLHGKGAHERPVSPTKGMGGFVQSAMLKRTDSVNKRWSVQGGPSLTRENSVASVRSSGTPTTGNDTQSMPKLDEHRPLAMTRPESFAAPAVSSLKDSETHKALHSRSKSIATLRDPPSLPTKVQSTFSPPLSPSKKWSPNKSSWLESALSRPESPVAASSPIVQQPSWMVEMNKAKQERRIEGESSTVRTRPAGTFDSTKSTPLHTPKMHSPRDHAGQTKTPLREDQSVSLAARGLGLVGHSPSVSSELVMRSPAASPVKSPVRPSSVVIHRAVQDSPSRKDVIGSPAAPHSGFAKQEPEFRSALGNLKRTQTQNYVAPDVLKDNILRGKAGLNSTDGPKISPRKDELKESLLKRKEEIVARTAQNPPLGNNKSPTLTPAGTPEALMKRGQLGKVGSLTPSSKTSTARRDVTPEALALLKSIKSKPQHKAPLDKAPASPGKTSPSEMASNIDKAGSSPQTCETARSPWSAQPGPKITATPTVPTSNKVAGRANPALAALLAKGAPADTSKSAEPQTKSGITVSLALDSDDSRVRDREQHLTHMTKSRAKGPKRRKPKDEGSQSTIAVASGNAAPTPTTSVMQASRPRPAQKSAAVRAASIEIVRKSPDKPPTPSKSSTLPMTSTSITKPGSDISGFIDELTAGPKSLSTKPKDLPSEPEPPAVPKKDSILPQIPSQEDDDKENKDRSNVMKAAAIWEKPTTKTTPTIRPGPIALPKRQDVVVPAVKTTVVPMIINHSSTTLASTSAPIKPAKSSRSVSATLRDMTIEGNTAAMSPIDKVTCQQLEQFFGSLPQSNDTLDIDVQQILNAKVDVDSERRSSKTAVLQITADGKTVALPASQQHVLFDTCMYVCTHAYESPKSSRGVDAYLWVGAEVSPSAVEDVQIFTKRAAKDALAGARNVPTIQVVHQTREPASFFQALGGILIVRHGPCSDGSRRSHVLCGRSHAGFFAFDEIDTSNQRLCSAYTYIAAVKAKSAQRDVIPHDTVFLWKGVNSGPEAVGTARLTAMDLNPAAEIIELEGSESAMQNATFASLFPSSSSKITRSPIVDVGETCRSSATHARLFKIESAQPRRPSSALFAMFTGRRNVSPSPSPSPLAASMSTLTKEGSNGPGRRGSNTGPSPTTPDGAQKCIASVSEMQTLSQTDLDSGSVYVLDALDTVYVLPGPDALRLDADADVDTCRGGGVGAGGGPGGGSVGERQRISTGLGAHAFVQACHFGNVYAMLAAEREERSRVPRVVVLLADGSDVPEDIKILFRRRWDDERGLWGRRKAGAGSVGSGSGSVFGSSGAGLGLVTAHLEQVGQVLAVCCSPPQGLV